MAYKITDECVACGTCAEECPLRRSMKAMGSMRSTRMPASSAEPAQMHARPAQSKLRDCF